MKRRPPTCRSRDGFETECHQRGSGQGWIARVLTRNDLAQAVARGMLVLGCLASLVSRAATLGPAIDDPVAGEKLAQELRAMKPSEGFELTGSLKVSKPKTPDQTVPIKTRAVRREREWLSIYEVVEGNKPNEILVILHRENERPVYEHQSGHGGKMQFTGGQATNAFAGSDFALMDLGLDFFHWPTQVLVTKEMRKGRGCQVLESRPGTTNLYSRVLSWIDEETNGLLMAEAYDAQGKLLKVFEVKRVNREDGQLREAEIRNRQTKSSTRLQFESEKN